MLIREAPDLSMSGLTFMLVSTIILKTSTGSEMNLS